MILSYISVSQAESPSSTEKAQLELVCRHVQNHAKKKKNLPIFKCFLPQSHKCWGGRENVVVFFIFFIKD